MRRVIVCPECGADTHPDWERICQKCGWEIPENQPSAPRRPEEWRTVTGAIVVRSYPGRTQADAALAFGVEAPLLASRGYRPISQSWADGRAGIGRTMVLGLSAGVIRPNGFLVVTYELAAAEPPKDEKTCPMCAEQVKAAAVICRYCGHRFGD